MDQRFALAAGPFSTHMLLDGEHAGRVIQFLADIFADALKLAAASALGVFRLVTDHSAGKLRRQRRTLGLLACFGLGRDWLQRLEFGFDGLKVGVEQVVEQAALVRADLLAALGELVPLEDRNLVGKLIVYRFNVMDSLGHCVDLREQLCGECAQLLRCHLVDIGRGSHAADCARAGP